MPAGTITLLKSLAQKVNAIVTDNTNLFFGCNEGTIYKYVISGGATTIVAKLNGEIVDMTYYSNVLYVGLADGTQYSVTTA